MSKKRNEHILSERLRVVCLWCLIAAFSLSDSLSLAENAIRVSEGTSGTRKDLKDDPAELIAERLLSKIELAVKQEEAEKRHAEKERLEKRAEIIAAQLRTVETEIQTKIGEYLAKAEDALRQKRFEDARGDVKKALRMKEAGRRIIEEKIRQMAEEYAASQAEHDTASAKTGIKRLDRYDDVERIAENIEKERMPGTSGIDLEEKSREALDLLDSIDMEEKAYETEQRRMQEEKETKEREREKAELRSKKEKAMREQAEEIAKYIEKARVALNNSEFDEARKYAKKAMDINETARAYRTGGEVKAAQDKSPEKPAERPVKEKKARERDRNTDLEKDLEKAERYLKEGELSRARTYIGKVMSENPENEKGKALSEEIKRSEKEKEEKERKEAAEKYLEKARESLNKKDFDKAKKYAGKALEKDSSNGEAKNMLEGLPEEIKRYEEEKEASKTEEEKARIAEEKRKKEEAERIKEQKEEARIREEKEKEKKAAEIEAERRANEEAASARRAEKAKNYLSQAEKYLEEKNTEKARFYAWKALEEEKGNKKAYDLLDRVEAEEAKTERNEENKEKLEKASSENTKRRNKESRDVIKVEKYVKEAWKYLLNKEYGKARKYAYMARDILPTDSRVADVVTAIDKEEMFGVRDEEEEARDGKIQKALRESEKKGDAFRDHDEGKGWFEHISGIFKERTEELGDIRSGQTYTIDECVQLALARSQRMIVADKQIKLAEMRVWEARRDLLPEVTGKIERSDGKIGVGAEETRHYQGEKYSVEVKHNLFDGMGNWYALRQSQTNLDIILLEKGKVKDEVIESVKRAYYNLDKSIKAMKIQKDFKERINKLEAIAEKAHKEELIPKVEYLKIKGQNMQADFQYDSALEDINLAKMILFQELNIEPDKDINIKPVERAEEKISIGLDNCYTLAIANRPDFMIKTKTIEYYELERKIAKAKAWPKVEFQGSFGQAIEEYQPLRDDDDIARELGPEWYAGVKGSVPLWGNTVEYNYVREKWAPTVSSFRGTESATSYLSFKVLDDLGYFTNLRESQVGFENAKEEYLKAKEDLAVEVKEAYFKYKKALLQMEVSEAQVEHQKMFVDVLEERQSFGEMESSRVIEEYEKFSEHEYGLVQGDADYFISLAELNKAIGISDYFRPGYETKEYAEWKKGIQEKSEKIDEEYRIKSGEIKMDDDPSKAGKAIDSKITEKKKRDIKKEKSAKSSRKEERDREKRREEAQRKAREEEEIQKRLEKANALLIKARKELDGKNFRNARGSAKSAMNLMEDKREAKELISNIEREEKIYKDSVKKEKDKERERESELKEKKEQEEKERKTKERAGKYISEAKELLKENAFEKARESAKKALKIDPDNDAIVKLLKDINYDERVREESDRKEKEEVERQRKIVEKEDEKKRKEEERQRKIEEKETAGRKAEEERLRKIQEEKERIKKEKAKKSADKKTGEAGEKKDEKEAARIKGEARSKKEDEGEAARRAEEERKIKIEKEVEASLDKAEKELKKDHFDEARKYAKKALETDNESENAMMMLKKINEEEKKYIENENEEKIKAEHLEKERQKEIAAGEELKRKDEAARKAAEKEKAAMGKEARSIAERDLRGKEEGEANKTEEEARKAEEARIKEEAEAKAARRTEEEHLKKIEKEIEENLDRAERELKKESFEEARKYAKKALEIDKNNRDAIELLEDINAEEKAYIAAEGTKKAEEARIKKEAEAEAARRVERERQRKIEKEVEENLDKAERELKKERFDEARGYAKKALEIDPESSAAIEALKNINAEEKAYIAAETARKEGEARIKKEAEAEAARRAEEERQGKIEKEIEDNLDKAEKELKNGDFVKADEYAKKALNLDAKSRRAANMIASVKRAEIAYQSEQKRLELTQKASKEKEEKKRLSREKRQGAQQIANEKVKMYLRQAEEALSKKRFGAARGYVDKAFKNDGESPEIGEMLARIDREEVQHLDEFERERQDKENARREEKEKIKKSVENALRSANEALNKKDFAKAKEYAEKADAVSGGSDKTADMLRRIKDEQDIFEEAQRAKEMADIEAKRTQETERRKKEKERKKGERAEKVKGLLKSASVRLNKNDFEGARKTAEEALEIDEENRDVREMLDEITRREAEYESEQKRIRMEEEKRVINEQEDRKRDLRVSENLTNARDRMENRKFAKARAFVRDALKEDENNKDAAALMEKIDKEEAKYEKEQEFLKKQENDRVVRERKKAERDKKISSYLERAESELSRGRTERAMSYIERVLDLDKNNESAEKMIVRIKAMTTENEN